MTPENARDARRHPRIGLCADCERARRITSARESVFYLCEYSMVDPSYAKYPQLPVLQCAAYRPASR